MMKEQYTSPEVKLISFVAAEPIAFFDDQELNAEGLFESAAKVQSQWDIPVFFDWFND